MAVINIMADGSTTADITGRVITINPKTELAYRVIREVLHRMQVADQVQAAAG